MRKKDECRERIRENRERRTVRQEKKLVRRHGGRTEMENKKGKKKVLQGR